MDPGPGGSAVCSLGSGSPDARKPLALHRVSVWKLKQEVERYVWSTQGSCLLAVMK
jgi:hypothetical protein